MQIWPPPKPPRRHIGVRRAVRRTVASGGPVLREAILDVIPAFLAVLIALVLRHEISPHTISPFERDVIALFGGAIAYVVLAVLASGVRMGKEMARDFHAWPEHSGRENVVLNFVILAPDKVMICDALCEVTAPGGFKSYHAGLVLDPPTVELPRFYNFPSNFPGASVQQGMHIARWLVREDHESDQWIEVAHHAFRFPPPVEG